MSLILFKCDKNEKKKIKSCRLYEVGERKKAYSENLGHCIVHVYIFIFDKIRGLRFWTLLFIRNKNLCISFVTFNLPKVKESL
jgi:hypothetical protein